jgi:hypothetical protein
MFPATIEIESISTVKNNTLFLQNYADIFWHDTVDKNMIFTILNFDELCTYTQKQLNTNIEFEKTLLNTVFYYLKSEDIYCWYGNDIDCLDEITDYNELIITIKKDLVDFSGELYFHYKGNNVSIK